MEPEDVLLTMAQLGVAIAGFNGVATVLSHGEPSHPRSRMIGSILVTSSASMVGWSVVPLVLLSTPAAPAVVWRLSSLGWAVTQIGLIVYRNRQARRLGIPPTAAVHGVRLLAIATSLLQLANAISWAAAWPHVCATATSLAIALTAFFVLFHEEPTEGR